MKFLFLISCVQVPVMAVADIDWSSPEHRLGVLHGKKKITSKSVPGADNLPDVDCDELFNDLKEATPNAVLWQLHQSTVASSSTESCISDPEISSQRYILTNLYDDTYTALDSHLFCEFCYATAVDSPLVNIESEE